jgi:hypothetical protein
MVEAPDEELDDMSRLARHSTPYAAALAVLLVGGSAVQAADAPTQRPLAVAPTAVPSGQVNRYVIPNFYSLILGAARSFTGITVYNNSNSTCSAAVRFQPNKDRTDVCVVTSSIPPKVGHHFCSRQPGSFGLFFCETSCPGAGLTFTTGHAFITSTNTSACANLAVDAEVIYTQNTADDVIGGITRLSVNKIGKATIGD